ncbi:putative malate/L-lactate dehydrogenase [Gordonia polyisoprenivorans VH2]|uniref:Putative malate/L-lactate dehydrogenase n=1 Tax=Gordonia polyisoprenivorans (strain DSM 44266 / VH2) TaxID=1112204 RepID=H6MWQ5_GORPV|nr:Ldh family oxidoreductase [Gordonia polyisoprenivorans]AFA75466.1 putative malate/L-lactate dehydrogenase [Gordonia polyisoprenivorans VH2]OZC32385.1 lactate dehydrogenase [Gordonia polyisoprenivorans]UZF55774.1 Ldh family oxidoreductase [Gordonia polyisoprenivorans]
MSDDRVKPEALANFGSRVLQTCGVPAADADLVADSLVQADLWGHQSHGMLRLPWYVARLRSGAMTATTTPETLMDTGALALIDGHDGIGQVLTEHARREAVARARAHGVGVVGVRNSNHFGTAMYYTRRAAHDGCVSILTTNASPAMAPWGGREKVLGTNPWSIAAPAPTGGGVVAVDIANTAVARGKIYLARNKGETIPDGWAIDADGHPTTDPGKAIDGVILPMAGHKGYAITFMMDILSGALTGSRTGSDVRGPYEADKASGAGHLFLAIDVAAMNSREDYLASVGALIDEVKSTPLVPDADEIFYPGELEDRAERDNLAAGGVALAPQTRDDLVDLATEAGITPDFS